MRIAKSPEEIERADRETPTCISFRIRRDVLDRIAAGASRLGVSRSAFLVDSAVERLERMAGERRAAD